jgi:hypothetical protein
MSREVSLTKLPSDIEDLVSRLRRKLRKNNMAFSALFVGTPTNGNMIVIADDWPTENRILMLEELVRSAQETLDYYKGLQ